MRQTILTIAIEVKPRNLDALRRCIRDFKGAVENPHGMGVGIDPYDHLGMAVPRLHFASIMVFEDEHYDPLLTVELNFDGDVETFLPQLEVAAFQPYLLAMVRCCKRPMGRPGAMYDAVTAPGSKDPLAPFLKTCVVRPAVFHQGNRGLDRNRILAEQALFADVQTELASPPLYRARDARNIHKVLRATLIGKHPWLGLPEPERWTKVARIADFARLLGFVALVLICLSAPGMVLALLMPALTAFLVCAVGAVFLLLLIPGIWTALRRPRQTTPLIPALPVVPPTSILTRAKFLGALFAFLVAHVALVALVLALPLTALRGDGVVDLYLASLRVVAIGLSTIFLPVAAILLWLRWLEDRDPTQEDPHNDPVKLRQIMALEDQIAQNHMGSVVLIKPGVLRSVLLRAGLWGLDLVLRATQTSGYLGSMRTIHFAHWAILSNGGRLVFFSNFDSSWESYLDDFIEKAHVGLTLAWTNGIGFPPTRFLIRDGATNGRLFKAWARHSMAESQFWFSAYKNLSVDQIERQYRIASGLRNQNLSAEEAKIWACDL